MRLQKFLARAGVASRRKCEVLISQGRVEVNGVVVTEMGTTVDPECDVVTFDGEVKRIASESVVIMLNKPRGYLSAMEDARESRVVSSLVPVDEYPGLFPVGRLDKDTSGLLLFTTDGELGHALLHPSHKVSKRYVAEIEGILSAEDRRRLESGIMLEDGMTSPARCEVLSERKDSRSDGEEGARSAKDGRSVVALEIHEGRKRQVRRMFASLGHEVVKLHRESIGPLVLGDLPPGQWRILSDDELNALRGAC